MQNKKIVFITSSPMSLNYFLLPHIRLLGKNHKIYVFCNCEYSIVREILPDHVHFTKVAIERDVKPFADFKALIHSIIKLFEIKPDMVITLTPKSGLIGMLSSYLTNTRTRIHIFTGQVWVTKRGISFHVLKFMDSLIGHLATTTLADSKSQREFLIANNVIKRDRINVLGNGSISGVNLRKFKANTSVRDSSRKEMGFTDQDVVILFLGRVNPDKGILDLVQAFEDLSEKCTKIKLLVVGPGEGNIDKLISNFSSTKSSSYKRIGHTDSPEYYFNLADIFVLPSYREGFGTVILEAAAVKLPTIGTNIYGIQDAIINNNTGLLYEPGSVSDLKNCITKLIRDTQLRTLLGNNAYYRVNECYDVDMVSTSYVEFYSNQLSRHD